MSYDESKFTKFSPSTIDGSSAVSWKYEDPTGDTIATMIASGFFQTTSNDSNEFQIAKVNDLIYLVASDGVDHVRVTSIADPVTVITDTGDVGKTINGNNAAPVSADNSVGGMLQLLTVATTSGATANFDVVMTNKIKIMAVQVQSLGSGTASDTVVIKNIDAAITEVIDISSPTANTVLWASIISSATQIILPGNNLRVSVVDGGGSDVPS